MREQGTLKLDLKHWSEVVSTAPLPDGLGTASGIHFFEGEVYVCFRDRASVAVLNLVE